MGSYAQITIETNDPSEIEILVARLSECGFDGFEEKGSVLLAFADEDNLQEDCLAKILADLGLQAHRDVLPSVNWNESWEKNFPPVQVEDYCFIRADFHQPGNKSLYEVVITPKMSFGTGHHPTTWMMVKAMKDYDFRKRVVMDFGTGTGILSILAEKAGAAQVLAIDNDPQCIENAQENIGRNDCHRIELRLLDTLDLEDFFDCILANVSRNVILANLPKMRQQLVRGGVLIVSGLLEEDVDDIDAAAHVTGMRIANRLTKEGWVCLVLKLLND
jgi:ribosomal protein L11 methyltransferase